MYNRVCDSFESLSKFMYHRFYSITGAISVIVSQTLLIVESLFPSITVTIFLYHNCFRLKTDPICCTKSDSGINCDNICHDYPDECSDEGARCP